MAVTSLEFLRSEINGVEYFTVVATGASFMSQRGIARACGVSEGSIRKLLDVLRVKKVSRSLEPFAGKALDLRTKISKNGGKINAWPSDFCAAVIQHYAFEGREKAQDVLSATANIGLTSYIQSQTGWLPERYTSAPESHRSIDRILDEAAPWEIFFDPKFCRPFFGWFGGSGYWKFVYSWMTAEEKAKINQLNPPQNGIRRHKIHQFLPEEIRDRLAPHVVRLDTFMGLSRGSKDNFRALCNEFYGDGWQMEMDLT